MDPFTLLLGFTSGTCAMARGTRGSKGKQKTLPPRSDVAGTTGAVQVLRRLLYPATGHLRKKKPKVSRRRQAMEGADIANRCSGNVRAYLSL